MLETPRTDLAQSVSQGAWFSPSRFLDMKTPTRVGRCLTVAQGTESMLNKLLKSELGWEQLQQLHREKVV